MLISVRAEETPPRTVPRRFLHRVVQGYDHIKGARNAVRFGNQLVTRQIAVLLCDTVFVPGGDCLADRLEPQRKGDGRSERIAIRAHMARHEDILPRSRWTPQSRKRKRSFGLVQPQIVQNIQDPRSTCDRIIELEVQVRSVLEHDTL